MSEYSRADSGYTTASSSNASYYMLGGLGPNIGGEDWEKAKKKKELMKQYGR